MYKPAEPFEFVKEVFEKEVVINEQGNINISLTDLVTKVNEVIQKHDDSVHCSLVDISITDSESVSYTLILDARKIVNQTIAAENFTMFRRTNKPVEEAVENALMDMINTDQIPDEYGTKEVRETVVAVTDIVSKEYDYSDYDNFIKEKIMEFLKP